MKIAHSLTLMRDEKLYDLCKKYGAAARLWRQKFIGLLPEVNRRRLYEKKGFSSIFEFAAKLCGLSADQVRLALNLGKRFEDKPILKQMLENGEASINKLTRVASIATPENEEKLAEKIKLLPKSALDVWVRDEKYARGELDQTRPQTCAFGNVDGLGEPFLPRKSLPGQTVHPSRSEDASSGFQLAADVQAELNELHSKGIDVNGLLREMLKKRREEITNKKNEIAQSLQPNNPSFCGVNPRRVTSRYIPVQIKKILKEEFGAKCSISTCQKQAVIIHHTQRFRLSQNHDPRFLAPLCREHHAIAHSVDLKYHRMKELAGN